MLHASFSSSRDHSVLLTEHLVQVARARDCPGRSGEKRSSCGGKQCARALEKRPGIAEGIAFYLLVQRARDIFYASTIHAQSGIYEAVKVSCFARLHLLTPRVSQGQEVSIHGS